MRTLQIFESAVEAEILKTRLDAAGILAVVNGGEVATMLSHIGTAAVRVRLEVAPEDYERALSILEEDDYDRSQRTAWQCSRCDERNEPLFDLCWSCGKRREPEDALEPDAEPDPTDSASGEPIIVDDLPARSGRSDNPYAPSSLPESELRPARPGIRIDDAQETKELVTRVFRGAVIGTVLAPPLLTAYVVAQLLWQVPKSAYRNPDLRWRLFASWALCALAIGVAVVFWGQFYRY